MIDYTSNPSRSDWNYVMENSSSANILQTWEYGEALEKIGYKTLKILLYNDGTPVSVMLGKYNPLLGFAKSIILGGYGGGSPVILDSLNKEQRVKVLVDSLKILQEESKRNWIFQIKIHASLFYDHLWNIYEKSGFKLSANLHTPLIDISGTEENLWNNLDKKHRNAIKGAIKKE